MVSLVISGRDSRCGSGCGTKYDSGCGQLHVVIVGVVYALKAKDRDCQRLCYGVYSVSFWEYKRGRRTRE